MKVHLRSSGLRLAAIASSAVLGVALMGAPSAMAGGGHKGGPGGPKEPVVFATGLDNPRQLSFTPWGDLLVAEAGAGGSGPCVTSPEGGNSCFGTSGAITMVTSRGKQFRIVKNLPSIAGEGTGESASGPSDVAFGRNGLTVLIGLGAPPDARAALPAAAQKMGTLSRVGWNGKLQVIADLAAWEGANNPIADPDSNPSGMLLERGKYFVTDAGGNTVLSVNQRGRIKQVAAYDSRLVDFAGQQVPMQSVPTSVATRGWDGALYVSELTGFPFPVGGANIYRVDPRTGKSTVYATGLTNVTDLAFDGRTLYAVQLANNGLLAGPTGSVVKVKPSGTTPADHTTVAGDLFAPYGIAIRGGNAYVTTGAIAKDAGQVLKIRL